MKLSKQIKKRVDEHHAARDLVMRLLALLLEHGALDEYWFGPNQERLRPDEILRDGRVDSALELVRYLDAEGPMASPASVEALVLFVLAMLLEQRNFDPHLFSDSAGRPGAKVLAAQWSHQLRRVCGARVGIRGARHTPMINIAQF